MRIDPRVGRIPRTHCSCLFTIGVVIGLGMSPLADSAQASPLRGPRAAAWWAAWNLRHNAAWTAGGRVSTRASSMAASTYPAHWVRVSQAVMNPQSLWNRYFTRALANRDLKVRGPNAVGVLAVSASATGLLPQTPIVQYLMWRRSLNPARFDFYHPRLGPILQQNLIANTPPTVGGEKITPPDTPSTPPVTPPENPPPQIPEPSPLAIAVVLLSAATWARRYRVR